MESGERKLWQQGDSLAFTVPMQSAKRHAEIQGHSVWDFLGSKVHFDVVKPPNRSFLHGKLVIILDWPTGEGEE